VKWGEAHRRARVPTRGQLWCIDDGELLVISGGSGDADEVQDVEASTMARSSGLRWPEAWAIARRRSCCGRWLWVVEALLANRQNRAEEDVSEMRGEKIGRMELEGCRGRPELTGISDGSRRRLWASVKKSVQPGGMVFYGVWCNERGRGGLFKAWRDLQEGLGFGVESVHRTARIAAMSGQDTGRR
jgi:hypothetical protein